MLYLTRTAVKHHGRADTLYLVVRHPLFVCHRSKPSSVRYYINYRLYRIFMLRSVIHIGNGQLENRAVRSTHEYSRYLSSLDLNKDRLCF